MRKYLKAIVIVATGFIFICLIIAGLYIKNIGFNNIKLMYELNKADQSILQMEEEGAYVTKASNRNDRLKEKMKKEGWTYVTQEGSGYFFEKSGQKAIITARQIWNRHYVMFRVKDHVVNLAD